MKIAKNLSAISGGSKTTTVLHKDTGISFNDCVLFYGGDGFFSVYHNEQLVVSTMIGKSRDEKTLLSSFHFENHTSFFIMRSPCSEDCLTVVASCI